MGWRRPPKLRPTRFWPVGWGLTVASLLPLSVAMATIGCGHANVPCPTPTTQLDRNREEAERTQREVARARSEERALRARREEAVLRLHQAQAALDSLASPARRR